MSALSVSATHQADQPRWIVEFTQFKVKDEHQHQVIDRLGCRVMDQVLEVFLQAVTPGAYLVEQTATGKTIAFPCRRAGRRFIGTFGGRWVLHLGK